MAKRNASTVCEREGMWGVLNLPGPKGKAHPLDGAEVRLVTNRYSGVLVALIKPFAGTRAGTMLQIAPDNFLSGRDAFLKLEMGTVAKRKRD